MPVVGLFWDIDERVIARLRDAGILVVHQVGSVDEAIAAERAGAEIIIVQGREAGGHVRGTRQLASLLPDVVGAIRAPVLAAGGLASGADLVTAQALGADGIVLGTALMATREAFAHEHHKAAPARGLGDRHRAHRHLPRQLAGGCAGAGAEERGDAGEPPRAG